MENKVWYAVMLDREDNDWSLGSYDRDEAEKIAVKNLDSHPESYIAVIENDTCIEEIETEDFSPVYCYAARIVKAHDWEEAQDDLAALARWLDMEETWAAADGDTFEDVIRAMGEKIGVALV